MDEYDNIASVRFKDVEDYNTKIIGGLVGTFHSFSNLRKFDTINSIQLTYVRLLFTISEDFITVLAVDPEQTDQYYFKVVRTLLDCLEQANQKPNDVNAEDNFERFKISIEMIFSLIYEKHPIETIYPGSNKELIKETAKAELNKILKEIYGSHEKFFKKVIS